MILESVEQAYRSKLMQKFAYFESEARLATFTSWIFSDKEKCNATAMAKAGFIFIGNDNEPDSVRCFFCKKPLDGWEADDSPLDEHIKHSGNCQYAQFVKKFDADKVVLEEYIDLRIQHLKQTVEDIPEEFKKLVDSDVKSLVDYTKTFTQNSSKGKV